MSISSHAGTWAVPWGGNQWRTPASKRPGTASRRRQVF